MGALLVPAALLRSLNSVFEARGTVLAVSVLLGAAHSTYAAESATERLKREAIALFQVVLKLGGDKTDPCAISNEWLNYDVPEKLARTYLGSTVHANLVAAYHGTKPSDVIDADGTKREVLCDKAQNSAREEALVAALKSGSLPPQEGARLTHPGFSKNILSYAFPVFDQHFRRAIVVVDGLTRTWTKNSAGEVKRIGMDFIINARVFAKQGGTWRLKATESLAHGH